MSPGPGMDLGTQDIHFHTLGITFTLPTPCTQSLPPAGRLHHCYNNWLKITTDTWVLHSIQGYHLELSQYPVQKRPPPELPLSERTREHIDMEVRKLMQNTAVSVVDAVPNQFVPKEGWVTKARGKPKTTKHLCGEEPLQDGRSPYAQGGTQEGRLDGLNTSERRVLISSGGSAHRKFLRFLWKGLTYEFQCLPFGLSSAPRTFTKLLKPVMAILRQRGLRSVIFIDDILLMAQSPEELNKQTQEVILFL